MQIREHIQQEEGHITLIMITVIRVISTPQRKILVTQIASYEVIIIIIIIIGFLDHTQW